MRMDKSRAIECPAERLRAELLDRLLDGYWAPGSRLPTERALCDHYGVGRSVLRRVLRELKERGLIVQRVGSGTYVAEPAGAQRPSSFNLSDISPAQIMEARIRMEPMVVDLVVANATSEDFAHFDHCCEQAEAAATLEEFERWDGALHQHLAEATRNAFFVHIFGMITEARSSAEWGVLKKKSVNPERRTRYQNEHRALVSALKQRDADEARRLLTEHLVNVRTNLLGSL